MKTKTHSEEAKTRKEVRQGRMIEGEEEGGRDRMMRRRSKMIMARSRKKRRRARKEGEANGQAGEETARKESEEY